MPEGTTHGQHGGESNEVQNGYNQQEAGTRTAGGVVLIKSDVACHTPQSPPPTPTHNDMPII